MVLLASELGWSHAAIEELEEAAYLHDIGKIAVSDRVLLKAGPLDERGVGAHAPASGGQRRDHRAAARAATRRRRAPPPRALRRHRLPRRARGRPDPGVRPPPLRRRLLRRDVVAARLQEGAELHRMPRRARALQGTQFDPALVDAFVRVLARMEIDRRFATQVASEAAACVDPAKHALLRKPADETRPEYAEICAALRAVRAAHPKVETVLTEVLVDERRCMVVVDSTEDPAIRSPIGELQLADDEELALCCGRTSEANVLCRRLGRLGQPHRPLRDARGRSSPRFGRRCRGRGRRPAPRAASARPSRGS